MSLVPKAQVTGATSIHDCFSWTKNSGLGWVWDVALSPTAPRFRWLRQAWLAPPASASKNTTVDAKRQLWCLWPDSFRDPHGGLYACRGPTAEGWVVSDWKGGRFGGVTLVLYLWIGPTMAYVFKTFEFLGGEWGLFSHKVHAGLFGGRQGVGWLVLVLLRAGPPKGGTRLKLKILTITKNHSPAIKFLALVFCHQKYCLEIWGFLDPPKVLSRDLRLLGLQLSWNWSSFLIVCFSC